MADDLRRKVEELIDKARTYGCIVWLDATAEIVFLDTIDQQPQDRLQAEAITRELMEAEELREVLRAVLVERRLKALAAISDRSTG
jgi:hypothetical protein